ncbi:MAG: hypothetical protein U0166_13655 [Acidobacteriota bacterium]
MKNGGSTTMQVLPDDGDTQNAFGDAALQELNGYPGLAGGHRGPGQSGFGAARLPGRG